MFENPVSPTSCKMTTVQGDIFFNDTRNKTDRGMTPTNPEFVTVVTVDPVEPKNKQPFVTILSIGTTENDTWNGSDSEEVLVYRLPGERLGFGLKFEGGSIANEKVTKLMIQSCAPDSPASRTMVSWGHFSPGDEILQIDNVPVTKMTRMECVRSLKESNVQLKLRVRKGDINNIRASSGTKQTPKNIPPPVPPRKYPRRNCKPVPRPCTLEEKTEREKFNVPEPQLYTDLIGQETVSLGNHESESDDTGSSMSTVVDKQFSTPTTSNSSFSDIRSITSAEITEPPSPDDFSKRKYDLDKVLEPFLQLEREFSSSVTIEDNNDLFQKLVAAAILKENSESQVLQPPDKFQDTQCYQSKNTPEVINVPSEEPPKPLPRKEIPKTVTKYGKKRPPPPPPQINEKYNRCPTPNQQDHHESSDSDISVDHLPRLIDFVPKDRVDLIIPSAVHPNPVDVLLEHQRILAIVHPEPTDHEGSHASVNEVLCNVEESTRVPRNEPNQPIEVAHRTDTSEQKIAEEDAERSRPSAQKYFEFDDDEWMVAIPNEGSTRNINQTELNDIIVEPTSDQIPSTSILYMAVDGLSDPQPIVTSTSNADSQMVAAPDQFPSTNINQTEFNNIVDEPSCVSDQSPATSNPIMTGEGHSDTQFITSINNTKSTADNPKPSTSNAEAKSNDNNLYEVLSTNTTHSQKFHTQVTEMTIKLNEIKSHPEAHIKEMFDSILKKELEDTDGQDKVGVVLNNSTFNKPLYVTMRHRDQLTVDVILAETEKVVQSNEDFFLNEPLDVKITVVHLPRGQVRNNNLHGVSFDRFCERRSKSIVTIKNSKDKDMLCLPRAIIVGKAFVAYSENEISKKEYEKIKRSKLEQRTAAVKLCKDAIPSCLENFDNIRNFKGSLEDVDKFQKYLGRDDEITVYDGSDRTGKRVLYKGNTQNTRYIDLILDENHYNLITSLTGAFGVPYYCRKCNKGYSHKHDHHCKARCKNCNNGTQCKPQVNFNEKCRQCNIYFRNAQCFDRHRVLDWDNNTKSLCDITKYCFNCQQIYTLTKKKPEHKCWHKTCKICKEYVPKDHLCYVQKLKDKSSETDNLLVFFDFEARVENSVHIPNFCVIQHQCERCADTKTIMPENCTRCGKREYIIDDDGDKLLDKFFDMIGRKSEFFKNVIIFAHNGGGYDFQFIAKYMIMNKNWTPEIIKNGSKIMSMKYHNFTFKDTLYFFGCKLAELPKMFGIEEEVKGYFPHHFNLPENQNYVGPMPEPKEYGIDYMSIEEREKFEKWYKKHQNSQFNFKEEMRKYCKSDVDILRKATLKFGKLFRQLLNLDPLTEAITIPSACMQGYRLNYLPENTVGLMDFKTYHMRDNQSKMALRYLLYLEKKFDVVIQSAYRGREKVFGPYKVDGYVEDFPTSKLDNFDNKGDSRKKVPLIVEIHGCLYHGCVNCYSEEERNTSIGNTDKSFETLHHRYENTKKKIEYLRKLSCRPYIIEAWECDIQLQCARDDVLQKTMTDAEVLIRIESNREAFFGGRTECFRKYYKVQPGEQIGYIDVNSLYPYVNKYGVYPVGHPEVLINEDAQQCDLSNTTGIAKVKILPPKQLFFPMLPLRMNKKLMFILCHTCAEIGNMESCNHTDEEREFVGTYTCIELKEAILNGYTIKNIYEVWSYESTKYDKTTCTGGIFAEYINKFLKIKQAASDFPPNVKTDKEKQEFCEKFEEKENIDLEPEEVKKNPGLRSLSKLCLNSLWGKFGQRNTMTQTSIIDKTENFTELVIHPEKEITDVAILKKNHDDANDDILLVSWKTVEECAVDKNFINPVISAYVTAQARLHLFSYLKNLEDRALYCDTDSIIYIHSQGDPEIETGPYLGEMKNEMDEYVKDHGPGCYIDEFVCGNNGEYAESDTRDDNIPVMSFSSSLSQISKPLNTVSEDCATKPSKKEEDNKMESLLTLRSSPPAYSRMPPDGHEFPQNYQEIGPNGTYELATIALPTSDPPPYTDSYYTKKSAYIDVVNEAKLLDVERKSGNDAESIKMPHLPTKTSFTNKTRTGDDAVPGIRTRGHASWRNDEKSERSVKDKIAMFSNAIVNSAGSQNGTGATTNGGVLGNGSLVTKSRHRAEDGFMDSGGMLHSRVYSKSIYSMNGIGCRGAYSDLMSQPAQHRFKSKDTYPALHCQRTDPTNPINIMNRTQSSIDLTLSSSSCSSAYSSCSPDSSLSPMSSPSYTIGSSSTLPRKHKSHHLTNGTQSSSSSCSSSSSYNDKKHTSLTRTTSFTGTTTLHSRSQSLVDVLHTPHRYGTYEDSARKDSLTTLIEQRRRTMSKLRGLVIPEKMCESQTPIIDLPEIKSKETDRFSCSVTGHSLARGAKQEHTNTYDSSWKSVLNATDMPKYSPAFKRKTLTVYGISSSASSLSSSLNSSREELRSDVKVTKSPPPAKPPRNSVNSYNNSQLLYGPPVYKSLFSNNEKITDKKDAKSTNDSYISRMDICKLQEDSDNDSAVSSSRSSLCQEYSPPSSPSPNTDFESQTNDRISNDSPSQSSSRTLRRTLSSETNVSVTSTISTLTSGSQASCSSSGDNSSGKDSKSKRILKAESVEAINRKNVLSSAKYSCGQDFKVGSPLIKDVFENQQNGIFAGLPASTNEHQTSAKFQLDSEHNGNWYGTGENIKVAYLELQDSEESDFSTKENSSSADTDDNLDKSLELSDSLCGSYTKVDYATTKHIENSSIHNEQYTTLTSNDVAFTKLEKQVFEQVMKNEDRRKSEDFMQSAKITTASPVIDPKPISHVSDIKKTFEKAEPLSKISAIKSSQNHLRMSSMDSTTSEDSLPTTNSGSASNLLKEQQFGSITSLASSTSLISQQELQQLIDEANQTLEETAGSGGHDLMVIILHRETVTSSIGITLAGGADYETKEITVHKVLVGSPADKDGRIQKGDRILSINGRNMKGVTHREALSILKAPRSEVVLVVSRWRTDGSNDNTTPVQAEDTLVATFKNTIRPPRIPEVSSDCDSRNFTSSAANNNYSKIVKGPVISVTLIKEGGGLGFSLEGGKDSPFGDLPLTIKKIFTGGCAAKSGMLFAGDELLSLNGVDITSMSRTEAWNMMKRLSDGQVILNVRRSSKE